MWDSGGRVQALVSDIPPVQTFKFNVNRLGYGFLLHHTAAVRLEQVPNFFGLPTLYLYNGDISTYLIGLLRKLNETMNVSVKNSY